MRISASDMQGSLGNEAVRQPYWGLVTCTLRAQG